MDGSKKLTSSRDELVAVAHPDLQTSITNIWKNTSFFSTQEDPRQLRSTEGAKRLVPFNTT